MEEDDCVTAIERDDQVEYLKSLDREELVVLCYSYHLMLLTLVEVMQTKHCSCCSGLRTHH